MYRVLISETSQSKIDDYSNYLWEYYDRLFDDTGLGYAEDIIKKQYKQSTDILRNNIYNSIENTLSLDTPYGYSFDSIEQIYTITIPIGTRRMFIRYKEYIDSHTRLVIDISIIRK